MMDGYPISISDLCGNPSVIVFLTAWCPACKEESPHINQLAAEYGAKGVSVLVTDIREGKARTRRNQKF
jgi:thiol-disulfide isomerase/thioredoxin